MRQSRGLDVRCQNEMQSGQLQHVRFSSNSGLGFSISPVRSEKTYKH